MIMEALAQIDMKLSIYKAVFLHSKQKIICHLKIHPCIDFGADFFLAPKFDVVAIILTLTELDQLLFTVWVYLSLDI